MEITAASLFYGISSYKTDQLFCNEKYSEKFIKGKKHLPWGTWRHHGTFISSGLGGFFVSEN
jgi:hypothetical protein